MASLGTRLRHAWNAFSSEDRKRNTNAQEGVESWHGPGHYGPVRPDRPRSTVVANDKTLITSMYMRMAIDAAMVELRHVRLDDQNRYLEDMPSLLNDCLTVEPNQNQGPLHFFIDLYLHLFQKGCIAVVPIDTTQSIEMSGGFDIRTMRVGEITQWYSTKVRVKLWRWEYGRHEELVLPMANIAIVENPFYSVMNEPNSILKRIARKLALMDNVDEASASGKLDLIIQLPYTVRGKERTEQAQERVKNIEFQLSGGDYGIAYADATEKITQLNRPVENNLLKHVEYLTGLLFSMLGLTPEIMNGTAEEQAMLNYSARTTKPLVRSTREAMHRAFLTKTARTQKQAIMEFVNPFSLVPLSVVAEIADKFARNEIFTANEIRQFLGIAPHPDQRADQLQNSNMPVDDLGIAPGGADANPTNPGVADPISQMEQAVNEAFKDLNVEPKSG